MTDVEKDLKIEMAILGCIVLYPDAVSVASEYLTPNDFKYDMLRDYYKKALSLMENGKVVELLTLIINPEDSGFLATCMEDAPTVYGLPTYCGLIKQSSQYRKLTEAIEYAQEMLRDGTPPNDVAELLAEAAVHNSTPADVEVFKACDEIGDHLKDIKAGVKPKMITTGISRLDLVLGCFQQKNLYIVGGRPGAGKTALGLSMADSAALAGQKVLFFSLEMPRRSVITRLISRHTSISHNKLRDNHLTADEIRQVESYQARVKGMALKIVDRPALKVAEIRAITRRIRPDIVFIDYLGFIAPPKAENRTQEISKITCELAAMAKSLDLPVVCLAQLNRAVEKQADKRPMLGDLRDSGSIEQDAYAVMFVYREGYYNSDPQYEHDGEIIVAKNRNGETGNVKVYWDSKTVSYSNLDTRYEG